MGRRRERPRGWPYSSVEGRRRQPGKPRPLWAGGHLGRRRWGFVSAESVAYTHGARVVFECRGRLFERIDWDLVVEVSEFLLGYDRRPSPTDTPGLMWRAVQEAVMVWPPLETLKEGVLEVLWRWSQLEQLDDPRWCGTATRRLQRARELLEGWEERRLQLVREMREEREVRDGDGCREAGEGAASGERPLEGCPDSVQGV